jgi:hypothetical protein
MLKNAPPIKSGAAHSGETIHHYQNAGTAFCCAPGLQSRVCEAMVLKSL